MQTFLKLILAKQLTKEFFAVCWPWLHIKSDIIIDFWLAVVILLIDRLNWKKIGSIIVDKSKQIFKPKVHIRLVSF